MFEEFQDMTKDDLDKKNEELKRKSLAMSKMIEMMAIMTKDPDLLLQDAYCKLNDNLHIVTERLMKKDLTEKQTSELTDILTQLKNILADYLKEQNLKED